MAANYGAAMNLILYGTDHCQLCDEALAIVESALETVNYQLDITDISQSDDLMEKYAFRIPVLKGQGGELDWPFNEQEVRELLIDFLPK